MRKVTLHGKTDPCLKKIRAHFDPINAGKDVIVWREKERRPQASSSERQTIVTSSGNYIT